MKRRSRNRGSALSIVLVLMIFLMYFSALLADMAYTNIKLSRSYGEDRRMYRGTDYVVNIINKRLQEAVKNMQNNAKSQTERELEPSSKLRQLHTSNEYLTNEGAMPYEDYEYEFWDVYVKKFNTILHASEYAGDSNGTLSSTTLDKLSTNESTKKDGYYTLSLVNGENMYYKLASGKYDKNEDTIEFIIYTKHEYTNEIRDGSMQQQTTTKVKFKLSDGRNNFNLLNLRVVNKKNDMLPVFTNQMALLSEKNILFLGGDKKIDVLGDVIAFGYVPTGTGGKEKTGATWKEYGGVIFGYSPKLEEANIFGTTWTSEKNSIRNSKINAGEVTIDGDVSTLGYVNIARNWDDSINICGDTYARQFVLSEDSHRANVWLGYGYKDKKSENDHIVQYDVTDGLDATWSKNKVLHKGNLYVTDDLQVDSSFAKLVVEGDYYGLSDTYVHVGGTGTEGDDMTDERRTSTLNINGDSVVELRNKVYVGGTSVLTKIRNNGVAYVTGISGAKTSQISAEAYIKSLKNPNVYVEGTSSPVPAVGKVYSNSEESSNKDITMINGYNSVTDDKFNLNKRAYHFKKYFEDRVQSNFGLMGTMNFGNLRIKTDDNGKIQGWAEGVIIAAGVKDFNEIIDTEEVKAYFGTEFSESETTVFDAVELNPASQYSIIQKYQASQATFLETSMLGDGGRKIVQTGVDKHITGYLNRSDSVLNDITKKTSNGVYLHRNDALNAHLYYSKNTKTVVKKDGNRIKLESGGNISYLENGYKKGVIFVEGDIFIEDGVEFEGVVVASGNITVSGAVKITRKADTRGQDVVSRLMNEDYYVKTFFGQNDYDIFNSDNLDVERISQDYVKIVDYEVGYTE